MELQTFFPHVSLWRKAFLGLRASRDGVIPRFGHYAKWRTSWGLIFPARKRGSVRISISVSMKQQKLLLRSVILYTTVPNIFNRNDFTLLDV